MKGQAETTERAAPSSTKWEASWQRRLTSPLAAAIVLGIFYFFLLLGVRDKSATMDELRTATAGYTYWKFDDYRLDPENGNLPKRWLALPLLAGANPFPDLNSVLWQESSNSQLADEWFNQNGDLGRSMLARGRSFAGLVAVALGALVWWWSRQLFGATGAMLSLLLYVCSPIVLANGALITTDLSVTFFFLLSTWCFDRMLRHLTVANVVASATAIAGLFLAKMSAIMIVPIALVLAAMRVFDGQPLPTRGGRLLTGAFAKGRALTLAALGHVVIILVLVWASFGFRYSAFSERGPSPGCFNAPWEWMLDQTEPGTLLEGLKLTPAQAEQISALLAARRAAVREWTLGTLEALPAIEGQVLSPEQVARFEQARNAPPSHPFARLLAFARNYRFVPEAYIYGCAHIWRLSGWRGAFLNGEISLTGWRTFFPFTFAVKTPLAALALAGIAFTVLLSPRARNWSVPFRSPAASVSLPRAMLSLWVLMAVYWLAVIASNTNIGHRHLLPVYPPLFVACGAVVLWWTPTSRATGERSADRARVVKRTVVGVLASALILEAGAWFPNYLAYFNGFVRPARAYRHLIDSSLDWGQDLPAAKHYIDSHPTNGPFFLAYFGVASPRRYGITAREVYEYPGTMESHLPPWLVVEDIPGKLNDERLQVFFRDHPDFDPTFVADISEPQQPRALIFKRLSFVQLEAGTYLISASLVQSLFYHRAGLPWSDRQESRYQSLYNTVRPLLVRDYGALISMLKNVNLNAEQAMFSEFEEYRFARLAAFLRAREPDENINYSILVYHLTAADIDRAVNGPPPYEAH